MNREDTRLKDEHLSYLLTAYAFESISEAGRLEVERHLASCAECRAELAEIRATVSSVRGAYPEEERGGASTFEQRKLERVLAAVRSRRRGRITWLAWPVGAAAGLLLFAVFLASTVQLKSRGRSSVVTEYMHVSDGEDMAVRVNAPPAASAPVIQEELYRDPTSPAQAPTVAAKPPDVKAYHGFTDRDPEALRRLGESTRGEYRHRVVADEAERAGAEVAGAPTAEGLQPPGLQTPPAPEKPAELAQAYDASKTRNIRLPARSPAPAEPSDRWGRKVAGRDGAASDHLGFGVGAAGGAQGAGVQRFDDHFGAIIVDAEKKTETEAKLQAGIGPAGPPTDGGVQGWSYGNNERDKFHYEDAAAGRGKVPIKNLQALKEVAKGAEAEGQKADGTSRYYFEAPKAEFTEPDLALDADGLRDATNQQMFAAGSRPLDPPAEVAFAKELNDIILKDVPLTLDTAEQVQGVVTTFDWGLAYRQNEASARPSLVARGSRERLLRAWSHWKALDAGLGLDAFEARRLDIPPPSPGGEGLPAEEFLKRYGVHPFVETRIDAQSTFGMDVDTASYTIARGALAAGTLPRPDQVRVEELVNYFPEPALPVSKEGVFGVACEGGPSLFGKGLDLLKITIRARDITPGERKDAVLTLAVDTSGSMHHGGRLALVREALGALVASLEPGDRVAIVGFGDHPYLVLPHTSAREAERILDALESLAPRGDTNFEAGLDLAYRVADEALEPRAVNRIILCSDGVATSGARGADELLAKIEAYARRGIHLSTLGVGLGKYNDRLLETLADRGNGSYAYADDAAAAADVFRKNLPGALQVLARDAKIQVAFDPDVVARYRLLGYENRDIADKDFRNDQVDAGEVGPGTTVTVLYEIERASGSSGDLGRIHLRYVDTGTGRVEENDYPLPPGVIATSVEASSGRFRFIACVAEMAELLRESYWARDGSFGDVLAALIALGPEELSKPEVREVVSLAARAQLLSIAKLEGK